MAWIRVEAGTRDHPKIIKLSRDCNVTVPHALGTVLSLWLWVATHCPDGNLNSYDWEDIELAAGWTGEPGQWYQAAVQRRLLDETPQGTQVHDWKEYVSSWREAQRMAEYRKNRQSVTVQSCDSAELSHDGAPDGRTDGQTEITIPPKAPRRGAVKSDDPSTTEEKNFELARNVWPGKKRGFRTEFENFRKKHVDWRSLLDDDGLLCCVQILIDRKAYNPGFWPHFQTFCNQNRYEEALQPPEVKR